MTTDLLVLPFENRKIRTVVIDGVPYWVAKDVAKTLGYTNPNDAISKHCKGVAKRYPLWTGGGKQEVRIISEADVLRLIVSCSLPIGVKMEAWIFEEVLPSIRKTGGYMSPVQQIENLSDRLRIAVCFEKSKFPYQIMPAKSKMRVGSKSAQRKKTEKSSST